MTQVLRGLGIGFLMWAPLLLADSIRLDTVTIDPDIESISREKLRIVHFKNKITDADHRHLKKLGFNIHSYLPDRALVVTGGPAELPESAENANINRIIGFKPSWKIAARTAESPSATYDVVPVDRHRVGDLATLLRGMGYAVKGGAGSFVLEVTVGNGDLQPIANLEQVIRIENGPGVPQLDMDVARIQGGADRLVRFDPVYKGDGIRGHVLEGIFRNHPDFAANEFREKPIGIWDESSDGHGHATFGIVFGSGAGDPLATGMLPHAQGLFTNYIAVHKNNRRPELTRVLIDEHQVVFQTASWGYDRTTEYTSRSAEMDAIIFDYDLPITQSQSNSGTRRSRPQAWAKNIISCGAVEHNNSPDPTTHVRGYASVGPAPDGRIKPDLVGYLDKIGTTAPSGYMSFGGTSGATPIVAGHLGLTIQLWTEGVFGHRFPVESTVFERRPHAATAKALLINSARQYEFDGEEDDLRRVHQGWGFPDVWRLKQLATDAHAVDEEILLEAGKSYTHTQTVRQGSPYFTATLVYTDPAPTVGAEIQRVNDLDLKVTAPDGTVYWGNFGLLGSMYSLAGGEKDGLNTVENVIIRNPRAGEWQVEVIAAEVNIDGHVETEDVDADFALVVSADPVMSGPE